MADTSKPFANVGISATVFCHGSVHAHQGIRIVLHLPAGALRVPIQRRFSFLPAPIPSDIHSSYGASPSSTTTTTTKKRLDEKSYLGEKALQRSNLFWCAHTHHGSDFRLPIFLSVCNQ